MDAKTVILQAIADEKAQVQSGIDALNVKIQALQDQIASGSVVTAADLDEIKTAVQDIFTPPAA